MKHKGVFPFRQTWYSLCSAHQDYKKACACCNAGMWAYDVPHFFGSIVYAVAPGLWQQWANRGPKKPLERFEEGN